VRAGDDACLYLNYPIGFPLLLAAAQRLFGSLSVAWYVPALSATVELVAVFGIGTALFGRWAGLLSAVVLAFAPTRLVFGTSPWSDLPGVVALTGGLALYLWAERTARAWLKGLGSWRVLLIVFGRG
jgi:4-amino-4-deoxy-L-arabinose transferase-like glycosyltransferase